MSEKSSQIFQSCNSQILIHSVTVQQLNNSFRKVTEKPAPRSLRQVLVWGKTDQNHYSVIFSI
ncbi:hypothetical protein DDV21_008890 [Streptococcus chenjunshii]|uniref:Uncharacterized protein n=1 Tax=Streptococcus chenjunshii TaxID=2173853 RepID=A0A372KKX4_9STRE|nr:hypothetical protein DDV21_008890 [Streptococcus chenjunshii]RFU50760.1 hypothetical protein DDV22_06920 [Streptococcus chenjunshii]RFU52941.1 hypothetical protein DDV23_07000 [Streptococcus chenjunshii]